MAIVDTRNRHIECKIVYTGPSLGGKTTNLLSLQRLLPPEQRSEMHSIADDEQRTIYFDYLPLEHPKLGDFTLRLRLYTVAGQDQYQDARESVLSGADGVVIVIDASRERLEDNKRSLDSLFAYFQSIGKNLEDFPVVLQFNKTDLPQALPAADLQRLLNPLGLPTVQAVALDGTGVAETLSIVTKQAIGNL